MIQISEGFVSLSLDSGSALINASNNLNLLISLWFLKGWKSALRSVLEELGYSEDSLKTMTKLKMVGVLGELATKYVSRLIYWCKWLVDDE